jgi:hypothetical protein
MLIARIASVCIAVFCIVVVAVHGDALVPAWAAPNIAIRTLVAITLLVIPMLLIWWPRLPGERLPSWVSQKTPAVEAFVAGWLLLLVVLAGVCAILWSAL